ncbi:hypothetical protein [Nostoc sp. CCY 9925]|uniref:hypothetical protein n=1 Tax=Nostoc sp. CCY 9925 TaxID=3103865 RepID=UPI0039C6F330
MKPTQVGFASVDAVSNRRYNCSVKVRDAINRRLYQGLILYRRRFIASLGFIAD